MFREIVANDKAREALFARILEKIKLWKSSAFLFSHGDAALWYTVHIFACSCLENISP